MMLTSLVICISQFVAESTLIIHQRKIKSLRYSSTHCPTTQPLTKATASAVLSTGISIEKTSSNVRAYRSCRLSILALFASLLSAIDCAPALANTAGIYHLTRSSIRKHTATLYPCLPRVSSHLPPSPFPLSNAMPSKCVILS